MDGIESHQHVHRPPPVERPARHVAEIDDLFNLLRADIGDHRFQREIVAVNIRNGGKAHDGNSVYCGSVPFSASTCPARYSEPVMRMRGGTS